MCTVLSQIFQAHDRSFRSKASELSECTICGDKIYGRVYTAQCGHPYDIGCLSDLIRSSMTDQTLFPPRCCKKPLALDEFRHLLSVQLIRQFESKIVELSTLDRLYCPQPTCSAFLGPATTQPKLVICTRCGIEACAACKASHSFGSPCATAEDDPLNELARTEKWQRCPGCRRTVELETGCYHMTCSCRTEFCYLCAARWKTCTCQDWDEAMLLNRAHQQVANQLGPRYEPAAPVVQQRVHAAAERLRYNHECTHPFVVFRHGARQCEHCHWYADIFLLVSAACSQCKGFCSMCGTGVSGLSHFYVQEMQA